MTRRLAHHRAQAMIEFGLVVPLLLMFMVATVDAGRFALAITALADTVREGARAAVASYPSAGWDARAADRAQASSAFLDPTVLHVSIAQTDERGGTFVTVTGEYRWQPITPFAEIAVAEIPLRATSRMLALPAAPPAPQTVAQPSSAADDQPSAAAAESSQDETTSPGAPDEPEEESAPE